VEGMEESVTLKIVSWNVNGIRAAMKKGFLEWVMEESPDILCVQETKARPEQVGDSLDGLDGYHAYWSWGERKGYSGVLVLSKREPVSVGRHVGVEEFDGEGRLLVIEYPDFTLCNVYFPNGQARAERLAYKLGFYEAFLGFVDRLRAQGRRVVCCGDFNTAHRAVDLARPKENEAVSGFLPEEREWMDRLEGRGFVDTFRQFSQEPGQYTYWDMKSWARDRNVGWRLDYFYVSADVMPWVTAAFILPGVMGSDHCPVGLELAPGP